MGFASQVWVSGEILTCIDRSLNSILPGHAAVSSRRVAPERVQACVTILSSRSLLARLGSIELELRRFPRPVGRLASTPS